VAISRYSEAVLMLAIVDPPVAVVLPVEPGVRVDPWVPVFAPPVAPVVPVVPAVPAPALLVEPLGITLVSLYIP